MSFISPGLQFLDRLRLFVAVAPVLIAALQAGNQAIAGSPIGELQYRFECTIGKSNVEIEYEFNRDQTSVGIRVSGNEMPLLIVNERQAFEQPFEVVTFEYLSACAQAQMVVREGFGAEIGNDRSMARHVIERADCLALAQMQREGALKGAQGYSTILDTFEFERSRESYLGVSYRERVRNIRERCPF